MVSKRFSTVTVRAADFALGHFSPNRSPGITVFPRSRNLNDLPPAHMIEIQNDGVALAAIHTRTLRQNRGKKGPLFSDTTTPVLPRLFARCNTSANSYSHLMTRRVGMSLTTFRVNIGSCASESKRALGGSHPSLSLATAGRVGLLRCRSLAAPRTRETLAAVGLESYRRSLGAGEKGHSHNHRRWVGDGLHRRSVVARCDRIPRSLGATLLRQYARHGELATAADRTERACLHGR